MDPSKEAVHSAWLKIQKYGNYARTLKASHGSLGRAMDLIPKPRTLKKVQLRDISWNLTPPTPAHGPRGHFIKAFFTPQYSRENVGISRIDLHCQKPLNSLNLMVFLKFSISHYKWSKSAVKSGRFWDRGRLAGVWRSAVWPGFPPIVPLRHSKKIIFVTYRWKMYPIQYILLQHMHNT